MKFRRRKYLINKGFQLKPALIFAVLSLLGSFIATAAFNFFALKKLETVMWSTHINAKTTGEIINILFMYVNFASFLFISVLLVISAVWMTKKAAGPIYRMAKDISKITHGDLTLRITLRQKDEFQDTANELDSMLQNIRERFKTIHSSYMNISNSLRDVNKSTSDAEPHMTKLNSALSNIDNLEKELSFFRLRVK